MIYNTFASLTVDQLQNEELIKNYKDRLVELIKRIAKIETRVSGTGHNAALNSLVLCLSKGKIKDFGYFIHQLKSMDDVTFMHTDFDIEGMDKIRTSHSIRLSNSNDCVYFHLTLGKMKKSFQKGGTV